MRKSWLLDGCWTKAPLETPVSRLNSSDTESQWRFESSSGIHHFHIRGNVVAREISDLRSKLRSRLLAAWVEFGCYLAAGNEIRSIDPMPFFGFGPRVRGAS